MTGEWCNVLLVLLSQLALWTNNLWSWALDNWGSLARWWERQEQAVKVLVLAGVTALLGGSAWALGWFVFACPNFPALPVAAFMIVSAIAGLFIGGKRHEEEKVTALALENDELRAEMTAGVPGGARAPAHGRLETRARSRCGESRDPTTSARGLSAPRQTTGKEAGNSGQTT